jgi:hypothetical protein
VDYSLRAARGLHDMQFLIYAMIVSVLLAEYLQKKYSLPGIVGWMPEIVSLIAAVVVIVRGMQNRFATVDAKYLLVFGCFLVVVVAGILINQVSPGVIFTGLRIYLKSLPFFFLPLLFAIEEKALRRQLLLIAAICLIQLPIAWDQRSGDQAMGYYTGDHTVGTLDISSILSAFLCSAAAIAFALYLRGRMSLKALLLFLVLTLPATMINETKGTLILLPIAIGAVTIFAGEQSRQSAFKRVLLSVVLLSAFVAAFVPVYDSLISPRREYGLVDFIQEGRVKTYLDKGAELGSEQSGKIDAIFLPFQAARADPARIAFGFGIGNISPTSLGPGFRGKYYELYGHLSGPSVAVLLWETGVFGLCLSFLLYYLVFRDALLARQSTSELKSALALGWLGVVGVMTIAMFYKATIRFDSLTYLFWFYSGVIVAAARSVRHSDAMAYASDSSRHAAAARNPTVAG